MQNPGKTNVDNNRPDADATSALLYECHRIAESSISLAGTMNLATHAMSHCGS